MVFVDDISELEFYNPHPIYGCYGDIITQPSDIILQAQLGNSFDFTYLALPTIKVYTPDGLTFLEDATPYFHIKVFYTVINGITFYYANAIAKNYSPAMINNGCFILRVTATRNVSGAVYFDKFTQKYALLNPAEIPVNGVIVTQDGSDNLAVLCYAQPFGNSCLPNMRKLVWFSDCTDDYNGDFFGDGITIIANTLAFVNFTRLTNLQGIIKHLPKNIKRILSINCRTQRTETTSKYQLQGSVPFPLWKMQEIEGMLLANRMFVDGIEKQSDGNAPFSEYGKPLNCVYYYKLEMELQDCFEWQVFGCTPACDVPIYYYPIAF